MSIVELEWTTKFLAIALAISVAYNIMQYDYISQMEKVFDEAVKRLGGIDDE